MNGATVYQTIAGGGTYRELAAQLGKSQAAVRALAGRHARANGLPPATKARNGAGEGKPTQPPSAYFAYLLLRQTAQHAPAPEVKPGPVDDSAAWVATLERLGNLRRAARVLFTSDQHFPDHDPLALRMVEEIALWFAPDVIVFGGDVFDMDAISRFQHDFRKGKPDVLRGVRQPYYDHVGRLKADNPGAAMLYKDGNHTAQRLLAYLNENWEFQDAILDTYKALVTAGGRVLYHDTVEEVEIGGLFIQHGRRIGKNAARLALDDIGVSQPHIQGHAHTPQMDIRRVRRPGGRGYRIVQSIVNGCLCHMPAGYDSSRTRESKWLQSVTLAHVEMDGDLVNQQLVLFHSRPNGNLCAYVGKKYFEVGPLVEARPVLTVTEKPAADEAAA